MNTGMKIDVSELADEILKKLAAAILAKEDDGEDADDEEDDESEPTKKLKRSKSEESDEETDESEESEESDNEESEESDDDEEEESIVLPSLEDIENGKVKKTLIPKVFKALGVDVPKSKKMTMECLKILVMLVSGDKAGLKAYPPKQLRDVAQAFGLARKKAGVDQIKELKKVETDGFKVPEAEEAAEESEDEESDDEESEEESDDSEEEDEDDDKPAKKGKKSKKDADEDEEEESDEEESDEDEESEDEDEDSDEDPYLAFVKSEVDFDAVGKDQRAEMKDWLKAPVTSKVGKANHAAVKKLIDTNLKKAYTAYMSFFIGDGPKGLKQYDLDAAYVRGDDVYCNGVPLEEAEIKGVEGVGKDPWSEKLFKVQDDNSIVEYSPKKAKKFAKKG